MSSDSNERCLQELKAEGTSDVCHGVAKGLAVGPCHVQGPTALHMTSPVPRLLEKSQAGHVEGNIQA